MSRREPGRVPGSAVARSAARCALRRVPCRGAQAVATTSAGCTGQPQSFGVEGPFANPCRAPDDGHLLALVPRWDSGGPSTPSTAGAKPAAARAFRISRPVPRGSEHRAWRICRPRPWAPVSHRRARVARLRVSPGDGNQTHLPPISHCRNARAPRPRPCRRCGDTPRRLRSRGCPPRRAPPGSLTGSARGSRNRCTGRNCRRRGR